MKPYLIDDGTLDTVIGIGTKVYRYHYDYTEPVESEEDGEKLYNEFIIWALDDANEQYEEEKEIEYSTQQEGSI
jgi:hypothetical protein